MFIIIVNSILGNIMFCASMYIYSQNPLIRQGLSHDNMSLFYCQINSVSVIHF